MHVAFVHPDPERETALARRMRRAAESLDRGGHEVTYLCVRWWGGRGPTFERAGVEYRAIAGSTRWFAASLPAALSRLAPDAVHAAGSEPSAVLAARLAGTPLVLDWCGEDAPRLFDRALCAANAVLVPSEHVRTRVRERVRGADATVIPEFVDTGRIEGITAREDSTPGLVWSGRLDDDAHLESLLLALAERRDRRRVTVTVIGDGPSRSRYERQARDLRVDDRTAFVGALPSEERIARLKGAHAFVQTADRCPFAFELLLALACGCVGIVEYRADSAAHELITGYDRGIGVTDDRGIVEAIGAATDIPWRAYEGRFERFSEEAVLEARLDAYRALGASG